MCVCVLRGVRPVQETVARCARLVLEQRVADAAPERKRRVGRGGAAGRDAGVTRRGERGALGRARLVNRLVERVYVDVGVERVRVEVAIVDVARPRERRAGAVLRGDVDERPMIVRLVRRRVDAGVVLLDEPLILQAVSRERGVRVRQRDLQVGLRIVPADVAEQLADGGRRVDAPAVLGEQVAREVPVQAAGVRAAVRELDRAPRVAAVDRLDAGAGIAASVLRADRERAAQRVEPEERIRSRHQRDLRDRHSRNQIPAHDVAERLVQPHAVHIDREPLLRAEQRRRGVAAVVDVGLKRVALHFVHVHAGEAPVQEVGEVERAAGLDVAPDRRLNRRGNVGEEKVYSRQRRRADHLDLERQRFLRRRRGRRLRKGGSQDGGEELCRNDHQ